MAQDNILKVFLSKVRVTVLSCLRVIFPEAESYMEALQLD